MIIKTAEELRAEMHKMFDAAHAYAKHSRLPGLEHRRDASIGRMNLCRSSARNCIAQIKSIDGGRS